jgi:hypothetical protein
MSRVPAVALVSVTLRIAAVAAILITARLSTSFAQWTTSYPEGTIFLSPPRSQPSAAAQTAPVGEAEQISPLNPLDGPDARNVWKPSNRDAGKLLRPALARLCR